MLDGCSVRPDPVARMTVNGKRRKRTENGFASRLLQLRLQKGISQDELARLTRIHKNQIGRYERGESEPTAARINKICSVLGVSKDYLFDGTKEGGARVNFDDADMVQLFQEVANLPEKPKDAVRLFLKAMVSQYKHAAIDEDFKVAAR